MLAKEVAIIVSMSMSPNQTVQILEEYQQKRKPRLHQKYEIILLGAFDAYEQYFSA